MIIDDEKAKKIASCMRLWQTADAVCFDVDSTLIMDEGINELAKFLGRADAEIAAVTLQSMAGFLRLRDALQLRLDALQLTHDEMKQFVGSFPIRLTDGARQLVERLRQRNVAVFLVSGGFRPIVEKVAELLSVPLENVFANRLLFDEKSGKCIGFDRTEPTSDSSTGPGDVSRGKAGVCHLLKQTRGYRTLVMVGDGATDAEAVVKPLKSASFDGCGDAQRPAADVFIGFGGVKLRPEVECLADWYVYDFATLLHSLDKN